MSEPEQDSLTENIEPLPTLSRRRIRVECDTDISVAMYAYGFIHMVRCIQTNTKNLLDQT